jgi:hypothetical protein
MVVNDEVRLRAAVDDRQRAPFLTDSTVVERLDLRDGPRS